MIIYSASKTDFISHVRSNKIESILYDETLRKLGARTAKAEVRSWQNSLQYMSNLVMDEEIPNDAWIGIEYMIPRSCKQIDFIISGLDEQMRESLVIVELKQWEQANKTEMDGVVRTWIGNGEHNRQHPSYQAWSYASLLQDFNQTVQDDNIKLVPCAYLHNCKIPGDLSDSFYKVHLDKAPIFYRDDAEKLAKFIKQHVRYGDPNGILYKIDNGKVRPSKSLADQLASMLKGKQEFVLIDEQKLIYETALQLAQKASAKGKKVLIIEGGPGSGKTVVAVNLLVELTRRQKVVQYVTKNAAPRAVYEQKLTGSFTKSHISNLFVGSGSFHSADKNSFDALIVDEAHRLNEKSGLFSNLGKNQIKEIIDGALMSVFFIDENQKVTLKDIGSKDQIRFWADRAKAEVIEMDLSSQFRCNGSEGYLSWLDRVLQIRDTANLDIKELNYDFKVFDDPRKLHKEIVNLNKETNKSRIVAGYCWEWPSKKAPKAFDIEIGDFKIQWNLTSDGSAWIIQPNSVSQAGCIHTCQGLELDFVGVIIGPDLIVRNGKVITDGTKRAKSDQSIKGFKSKLKNDPQTAKQEVDIIIKNTYRTLMTRGMKGCYLYCTDDETREYFKGALQ